MGHHHHMSSCEDGFSLRFYNSIGNISWSGCDRNPAGCWWSSEEEEEGKKMTKRWMNCWLGPQNFILRSVGNFIRTHKKIRREKKFRCQWEADHQNYEEDIPAHPVNLKMRKNIFQKTSKSFMNSLNIFFYAPHHLHHLLRGFHMIFFFFFFFFLSLKAITKS